VKKDIVALFLDFYNGKLNLYKLNFALLTLIPKDLGDRSMKKYRPISLCNCSFKIFSKVLTLRLGKNSQQANHPTTNRFHWGEIHLGKCGGSP
jgi:hypothetical protein